MPSMSRKTKSKSRQSPKPFSLSPLQIQKRLQFAEKVRIRKQNVSKSFEKTPKTKSKTKKVYKSLPKPSKSKVIGEEKAIDLVENYQAALPEIDLGRSEEDKDKFYNMIIDNIVNKQRVLGLEGKRAQKSRLSDIRTVLRDPLLNQKQKASEISEIILRGGLSGDLTNV